MLKTHAQKTGLQALTTKFMCSGVCEDVCACTCVYLLELLEI